MNGLTEYRKTDIQTRDSKILRKRGVEEHCSEISAEIGKG